MDFYLLLKVNRTATNDEIKSAYRKLVKEHHPDHGGNPNEFNLINRAYNVLIDAGLRRNHDILLQKEQRTKQSKHSQFKPKSYKTNKSTIIHRDRDVEVDLWKQTSGLSKRDDYWQEYERRKITEAYVDPDVFWKDLNEWWKNKK